MCSVALHESAASKTARIGLETSSKWTSFRVWGRCRPKGYNPQFCVLMITKHRKLFGTNQAQECVSGFKEDLTGFFH